ncbi:MAG: CreA family protein [Candidatus Lindowbacteria bacterium]|nr:CreA family protein [Candidatus Lindowbacteria bacterium]
MKKLILAMIIAASPALSPAFAESIGSVQTSGFIFKDSVTIHAVDDPTITGVTCYVTTTEIGGPNLEDPTDSSLACRQTGTVTGTLTAREDVFKQSKNILFFKTMHVDRFYDKKRNVLVYISYTSKLTGKNASHSISVVPLSFPLAGQNN